MENGEDEEDDALEDSMTNNHDTVLPVQLRAKPVTKRPEGRAPTMTIELVRVGRPLKVSECMYVTVCYYEALCNCIKQIVPRNL